MRIAARVAIALAAAVCVCVCVYSKPQLTPSWRHCEARQRIANINVVLSTACSLPCVFARSAQRSSTYNQAPAESRAQSSVYKMNQCCRQLRQAKKQLSNKFRSDQSQPLLPPRCPPLIDCFTASVPTHLVGTSTGQGEYIECLQYLVY